jgi:hypothetical protein
MTPEEKAEKRRLQKCAAQKVYAAKNKEKISKWYQQYNKTYYPANKKRILERSNQYYRDHKAHVLQRTKAYADSLEETYPAKIKREVLTHYAHGILQCAWCGINDIDVLCLDHVENNGKEHRSSLGKMSQQLYRHLRKIGYPDGFQVLCANCNLKKEILRKRSKRDARRHRDAGNTSAA